MKKNIYIEPKMKVVGEEIWLQLLAGSPKTIDEVSEKPGFSRQYDGSWEDPVEDEE